MVSPDKPSHRRSVPPSFNEGRSSLINCCSPSLKVKYYNTIMTRDFVFTSLLTAKVVLRRYRKKNSL